jgi:hypothetical protein
MATEKPEEKVIRLVWGNTDDIPSYYANHIQISFGGETEFHITFGHFIKPSVEIVASPDVMRAFVRIFESSLEKFEKRQAERDKKNV